MSPGALRALGLGADAESVYLLMLSAPYVDLLEIAEALGFSEPTVREALDELVRLSLLRESRDMPGRLRPVQPEVGFAAIIQKQEAEVAQRQQELAASKMRVAEALAEVSALRTETTNSVTQTEHLVGMDAILGRLEVLAKEVRVECLSVMPGGAQSQASLDASRPLDEDALSRGVALRTLYQDSVRHDTASYAYARWMTELGGEVRTALILPPRMVIFDREVAVIPIDPGDTKRGALCTSEIAVVASLVTICEQAWGCAVPLGASALPRGEMGVTPLEQELLRQLAAGLTDEAVGRRLGMSARSVRRQVAGLMERLGASSRFEAGLKAAHRGWI